MLGTYATPERLAVVEHEFGLDRPLVIRYGFWLKETVQGNLGESVLSHQPVTALLGDALPVTLELTGLALLIAVVFALPVGLRLGAEPRPLVGAAGDVRHHPRHLGAGLLGRADADRALRRDLGHPAGGRLRLLRERPGREHQVDDPAGRHAVALSRRRRSCASCGRARSASCRRTSSRPRGRRGSATRRSSSRHVRPNALIPTVTFLGLQLGALISGAIVTEVIFSLPGMGRLGLNAILNRDYPVVLGRRARGRDRLRARQPARRPLVRAHRPAGAGQMSERGPVRRRRRARPGGRGGRPPRTPTPQGKRFRLVGYLVTREPLACALVAIFVLAAVIGPSSRPTRRTRPTSTRRSRARRGRTCSAPTSSAATCSAACCRRRGSPPRRC